MGSHFKTIMLVIVKIMTISSVEVTWGNKNSHILLKNFIWLCWVAECGLLVVVASLVAAHGP